MKWTASLTIALLGASVMPGAMDAAEKTRALPKDLPPYGALKPPSAPPVKRTKLDNGMEIWVAPVKGFPKVALTMALRGAGYVADPKDRPGMADLIASVMSEGTKTRTARQVAEGFQAAGGDLNISAGSDAISLSSSVLGTAVGSTLDLLADVSRNATFADAEVEIARRKATAEIQAAEAEPSFLAGRALRRVLFGSHPYSVVAPTVDSIAKVTAGDLRAEYARRLRPDRALLVAVGDVDEAAFATEVRNAFGSWRSGAGSPPEEPEPLNVGRASRVVVYVPRANSVQTALALGSMGPKRSDPDFAATQVANAIFGGMFGSRLISNIREDKGYTYSPRSSMMPYRQTGIFRIGADVRNAVTGASYNEISYELNRMATTSPDPDELESAKRYLIGSMSIELQSRAAVARSLANLWIYSLPPEELGIEGERIEKVSAKDIEAASRKYFPSARMAVVAVGEEAVIKGELAPFAFEFQKSQ